MYQTKVVIKMCYSVFRHKHLWAKNSSILVPMVARFGTKTGHVAKKNESAFMEMVESRRVQARRSLIIEIPTPSYVSEVKTDCEKYGEINYFDYYSLHGNLDFVIVEFKSEESSNCVLSECVYESDHNVVPVQSPFLWYRATKVSASKKQHKLQNMLSERVSEKINEEELIKKLENANSINEQMIMLDRETCLSDLGIRLRFLTLYQIELALSGLFPRIAAFPFGSSITGFGRQCCDLDIVINLDKDLVLNNEASRLVFHVKAAVLNGRASMQRHLESIGDIFNLFLPGVSNMKRILQANVPIIKYFQDYTGLECDVSMNNMSAVNMSELLYNLRLFDSRVQPFVTTIHKWAYHAGLTHTSPGPWITNFSLTLLAIFFLQQDSVNVLPPVHKLRKKKTNDDVPLDNLETLLTLFLDYYSKYNFRNYAVNILSGTPTLKPDNSPMYIVNPIEPELNVSKNVSSAENEKFQIEVKNAYWVLNSEQVMSVGSDKVKNWGIVPLFKSKRPKQEPLFVKQSTAKKKNIVLSLWNDLQ